MHTVVRWLYGSFWPPLVVSQLPREDFDEDGVVVPLDMDDAYTDEEIVAVLGRRMISEVNACRCMNPDTRVKYRDYLPGWVQENGLFANYSRSSGFVPP